MGRGLQRAFEAARQTREPYRPVYLQHWQECDKRLRRVVRVLRVDSDLGRVAIVNVQTGRVTSASLARFRNPDGVSGGYRLLRPPLGPDWEAAIRRGVEIGRHLNAEEATALVTEIDRLREPGVK